MEYKEGKTGLTVLLSFRCKNEFHGLVEVFIFSFPTWSNPSVFIRNSCVMLHEGPMSLMNSVFWGMEKGEESSYNYHHLWLFFSSTKLLALSD